MGDTMLHAVLNMPRELWREDSIDEVQRQARYMEASARIILLERKLEEAEKSLERLRDCDWTITLPDRMDAVRAIAADAIAAIHSSNIAVSGGGGADVH